MLLKLFFVFFKIGLISFGGGYAMIPLIDRDVTKQGWVSPEQFIDIVAVAGMSPGAIAPNTAVLVGYNVAGVLGSIAATLGIILPSFILILILAVYLYRVQASPAVSSAFLGLRPVVTGLVFYAGVSFALRNGIIGGEVADPLSWLILLVTLGLLLFTRIHPILLIVLSACTGMIAF